MLAEEEVVPSGPSLGRTSGPTRLPIVALDDMVCLHNLTRQLADLRIARRESAVERLVVALGDVFPQGIEQAVSSGL